MQIRLNKLVLEKLSFENLNIVKTCIKTLQLKLYPDDSDIMIKFGLLFRK